MSTFLLSLSAWHQLSPHPRPSHGPQCLPESDLLAGLEAEGEVSWGLEEQHNGGAQVELAQVLAFAHAHSLLVAVGDIAEVVVRAFAIAGAVGVQLLCGGKKAVTSRRPAFLRESKSVLFESRRSFNKSKASYRKVKTVSSIKGTNQTSNMTSMGAMLLVILQIHMENTSNGMGGSSGLYRPQGSSGHRSLWQGHTGLYQQKPADKGDGI